MKCPICGWENVRHLGECELCGTDLNFETEIEEGKCHLCGNPVQVTKFKPPVEGDDKEGHFWLLDVYECNVCNVEQEHRVREKCSQ